MDAAAPPLGQSWSGDVSTSGGPVIQGNIYGNVYYREFVYHRGIHTV